MSLLRRQRPGISEADAYHGIYGGNGNHRIQIDDEHLLGVQTLGQQLRERGLGELTLEAMEHWMSVNLQERRDFLQQEPDGELRIQKYALDIAEMVGQVLHVSGKAVSSEAHLAIPAFDFDGAIVEKAVARVRDYYRQQAVPIRSHLFPVGQPLELASEKLYYKLHQLSVGGIKSAASEITATETV